MTPARPRWAGRRHSGTTLSIGNIVVDASRSNRRSAAASSSMVRSAPPVRTRMITVGEPGDVERVAVGPGRLEDQ